MGTPKRIVFLMIVLFMVHMPCGCALFDREEELDISRNVRVVEFPVRRLKFDNLKCRQESRSLDLSGSVRNVSYSMLSNVRLRVDILYSGEITADPVTISIQPSMLESGETGQFSLSHEVDRPVSHVELHAFWGDSLTP